MRFVLSDDFWVLDALNPVEWHFLCELPSTAAGENIGADKRDARLLPDPLSEEGLLEEEAEEQLADWDEFVRPEIASLFQSSRERVKEDIDTAQKVSAEEIFEKEKLEELQEHGVKEDEYRRVIISRDHIEAWYSTLNQARILMNEENDIAEGVERFSMWMGMEEGQEIEPDKAMLLAQYEMYTAIQSILVENLMGG